MYLFIYSYIADLIFGDPSWLPHPVKEMGKLISFLEKKLLGTGTIRIERLKGAVVSISVIATSALFTFIIIKTSAKMNSLLGNFVWVYFGYTTISVKDLFIKVRAVKKELVNNSLPKARERLSEIVGRDTKDLTSDEVSKAAIESVAESTSDGIVAPLFYLIIGGPVLAVSYKAINTLDSMLGYKNEKYIHFGYFAAKLDDIAGFIPARVTGFLIVVASFLLKKDFVNSFKIMSRDGRKHQSPNSGISEAAMSGALGVQLGGPSIYSGVAAKKAYIGDKKRAVNALLIDEALAISFAVSACLVMLGALIRWLI